MSFTHWYYLFFLAGVALLFWPLRGTARIGLLWAAGYVFYGCWDVRFLGLILASTVVDYLGTWAMEGKRKPLGWVAIAALAPPVWFVLSYPLMDGTTIPLLYAGLSFGLAAAYLITYQLLWSLDPGRRRKAFLLLSILTSLVILGFFKYCNFFLDSFGRLLGSLGFEAHPPVLGILLPVGISFYTFQAIAYAVDVYRGRTAPCASFPLYATFVSFFPQLVAGPIERSHELLPQLEKTKPFSWDLIHTGTRLLLVGYFQKVFVGDNCAILANYVFNHEGELNAPWVLLGVLAFAFQIYGDFSGYTNIARGSAMMFGVELSRNFRFPYFATGPSDFWARWHITLSTWFRDYLYIPLGGNRCPAWRISFNLVLTMLVAGLWHGAGAMFLLWGLYHGVLLVLYRSVPVLGRLEKGQGLLNRLAAVGLMFGLTLLGWMIFRSGDWNGFVRLVHGLSTWAPMATGAAGGYGWLLLHVVPLLLLQAATWRHQDETSLEESSLWLRCAVYLVLLLAVVSSSTGDQEFIYFQF
jgi:alginate O-acetyltransferase complex protein AlgI